MARNGHHAVVQQLIEAKADLDDTALIWVACNGHHATVQHFTEAKADVSISDGNGDTALSWVACNGHHTAVQQLIEARADMDDTALTWVACNATPRPFSTSSRRRPTWTSAMVMATRR